MQSVQMENGKLYPQILAAIIATGTAFSAGTALAWTNPVELAARNGTFGFEISEKEFGWLGPFLSLGGVIACIPSGFLIDAFGRKMAISLMVVPFTIGWIFVALAKNIWMLYFGRFMLGTVYGCICIAVPLYVGEIAQKEIRGILGSLFELQTMFGVFFVFVLGAFLRPLTLTIACGIVPLIVGIGMIFVPESPDYLIAKGKIAKAEKCLEKLHGRVYCTEVLPQQDLKPKTIADKKQSFINTFKSRACLKALCINIGLMAFQQLSGINPITFYSTAIFEISSSDLKSEYATLVLGVVQLLATLVALAFVDKLGRRLLLMVSAALMAFSLFILGLYFYFYQTNKYDVQGFSWTPVFCLCGYVIAFAFGFGPVPWILLGELFPEEVKGPAGSVTITFFWLMSFTADKAATIAKQEIGVFVTFWIFATSSALGFLFVLFFVPETKGKTLQEIQKMLAGDEAQVEPLNASED